MNYKFKLKNIQEKKCPLFHFFSAVNNRRRQLFLIDVVRLLSDIKFEKIFECELSFSPREFDDHK